MNINLFFTILNDKHFLNLKNLSYKYGNETLNEFIDNLKSVSYKKVAIVDFKGNNLVYIPQLINLSDNVYKTLLIKEFSKSMIESSMENEIENTLKIESINSSKNSIRNIVNGLAPKSEEENKIYGIKKGLDFVSDKTNIINEENLYKLYCIAINDYLDNDSKLKDSNYYRHDTVYVVGDSISHQGIDFKLLPNIMKNFIKFINAKDDINKLIKSTIIHFYFSYVHPYFDGNGRMARLIHIWYLIQNGFNSTVIIPFSKLISQTKNDYYKAFELIESNYKISHVIDTTPFITYFNNNVFNNIHKDLPNKDIINSFKTLCDDKKVNPKEEELFLFALFKYKNNEFSTLELEKDFHNVAYETVRKFVIKFTKYGFLIQKQYGLNRVKYKFCSEL